MLILTANHLINRGANRDCYQHPDDPGRCIKLNRGDGDGKREGMNEVEHAHYTALSERLGKAFYRHAPKGYGMVETNLGTGPCFELIRDADGARSTRLRDYLLEERNTLEHVMKLIDELEAFVNKNQLAIFDLNTHNLLVRRDTDGQEHLVIIDWKGPGAILEFIPISRWLPWMARMKTARRFTRLRRRTRAIAALDIETKNAARRASP